MNILVAILTDKWQEIATSKELYALRSMAEVIMAEDHQMTAAGETTMKRFIHVVRCAHDLQCHLRSGPCHEQYPATAIHTKIHCDKRECLHTSSANVSTPYTHEYEP